MDTVFNNKDLNSVFLHLQTNENKEKTFESFLTKKEVNEFNKITSESRKNEFIAIRTLLYNYYNHKGELYYSNKKPKLKNKSYISISHKKEHVIVATNLKNQIGIDIEKIDEKIISLKNKFCSENEIKQKWKTSDLIEEKEFLTMLWCAKEATYKCLENQDNIFLNNINVSLSNCTEGESNVGTDFYKLFYFKIDKDYVLCHAEKK